MAIRRRPLKPDPKGYFRPYLGFCLQVGPTPLQMAPSKKQPRFNLGKDKKEAERRMNRLYQVWDENVEANGGVEAWSPLALSFAQQVAAGVFQIEYPFSMIADDCEDPVAEYAQMIHVERGRFPSLQIVPSDPEVYAEGLRRNEALVGSSLESLGKDLQELGALAPKQALPEKLVPGNFHEALDAYAENDVRSHNVWPGTDELKQSGHRRLEMIERFRERHDDDLLSLLGYDKVKELIRYWCKRPPKKNRKTGKLDGTPISSSSALHHRKELDRFFRWLDATEKFGWVLPRGFGMIDRSIGETAEERARPLTAIQTDAYTPKELGILNHHATPLERLVLYVGLNCGMGAAELGRLQAGDFLLFQEHEFQQVLRFESTQDDSFARYLRPKTKVFGEWLLWPETVAMVQWGLERSQRIGSNLLFVSENAQPWYNERSNKNPQAKFTNVWNDLIARVQKNEPSFRRLPFGTLRDTLPNILRTDHSSEMASICLCHGSSFKGDRLLDCYTNKPFGRFHQIMRTARQFVDDMFATAPDNPTAKPIQQYTPLKVREEIGAMLDRGEPVSKIAEKCEITPMTVYREQKRNQK